MIVDATCAPSNIRYPQDVSLLNEAQWNGAAKTLVSPEWSCVIEDRDEEDMLIKVIRKEDLRML